MGRQMFYFVVSGTIGFVVDVAILALMLWWGLGPYLGRAISFFGAVLTTWQINRRLTFKRQEGGSMGRELLEYLLAMAVGGAVNYAVYVASVNLFEHKGLAHWAPSLGVALGSLAGMAINFFSAKFWVFRSKKN